MTVALNKIYHRLLKHFGPQHWWPGDGPFEVIVGAILTQNTNWGNVEKAIRNLRAAAVLTPAKLNQLKTGKLVQLIRPTGYYNIKAARLKSFLQWLMDNYQGNLKKMFARQGEELRAELLGVSGIGPETADSILLYAAGKPSFVVDAYTYRIFSRHKLIPEETTYDEVKAFFEDNLPKNVRLFNEYHALIVRLGKEYCKKTTPRCAECPMERS